RGGLIQCLALCSKGRCRFPEFRPIWHPLATAGAMRHVSSQRLIFHPLSEELIMSTALRKKMHQDLQLAGLSEGTQGRVRSQKAVTEKGMSVKISALAEA